MRWQNGSQKYTLRSSSQLYVHFLLLLDCIFLYLFFLFHNFYDVSKSESCFGGDIQPFHIHSTQVNIVCCAVPLLVHLNNFIKSNMNFRWTWWRLFRISNERRRHTPDPRPMRTNNIKNYDGGNVKMKFFFSLIECRRVTFSRWLNFCEYFTIFSTT